jgi:hypothetical protein
MSKKLRPYVVDLDGNLNRPIASCYGRIVFKTKRNPSQPDDFIEITPTNDGGLEIRTGFGGMKVFPQVSNVILVYPKDEPE